MEYLDTVTAVPLADLRPYPGNARIHDLDTIEESIRLNGQYRSLVVRVEDDGQRTILAGNGTAEVLATRLGVTEARCEFIRCDDAEAARINLVDNKSNDNATFDDEALLAQLRALDDLRGTGFITNEVDDLAALLEEQGRDDAARAAAALDREAGQSGVRQTTSISDYALRYGAKATRVLIAEFHNDVYAWVVDRLAELRDEFGVTSNADAIRRLLEEKSGREAPTVDGSVVAAAG